MLVAGAPLAVALPAETPDDTWMVNGPVRSLERVGSTVWIGGQFTELRSAVARGQVIPVNGLAAVDEATGQPVAGLHLPVLAGAAPIVRDLDVGGGVLYAGGKFSAVDGLARTNLVAIDPATGHVLPGFQTNAPTTYAVLADPDGGVYVGKKDVRRYRATGARDTAFANQVASVTAGSANGAAILDLDFADDGDVLVAGAFDFLNSQPHWVISRLDPSTGQPTGWELGGALGTNPRAIDLFVDESSNALFAAVGGSDFTARYRLDDGELEWKIDTSGASQGIARFDADHVVVGGHFRWVAAAGGVNCGSNKEPTGLCERRARLAAIDADTGRLVDGWAPDAKPLHFGIWTVLVSDGRLHVGGEFHEIEGVEQMYYARLS